MKKIALFACLFTSMIAFAQNKVNLLNGLNAKNNLVDYKTVNETTDSVSFNCPEPTPSDIKAFCDCIAIQEKPAEEDKVYFEYGYEARLANMACADYTKESQEEVAAKIRIMWEKHKTKFICRSTAFNLERGSILKFAVFQGFKPFIENIVATYGMDIDFLDPSDGRNLWDYVNDDLQQALKNLGPKHQKAKVLKEFQSLIEDLGGKPSKPEK